jgi:chaperonin cofactor prefoldin
MMLIRYEATTAAEQHDEGVTTLRDRLEALESNSSSSSDSGTGADRKVLEKQLARLESRLSESAIQIEQLRSDLRAATEAKDAASVRVGLLETAAAESRKAQRR